MARRRAASPPRLTRNRGRCTATVVELADGSRYEALGSLDSYSSPTAASCSSFLNSTCSLTTIQSIHNSCLASCKVDSPVEYSTRISPTSPLSLASTKSYHAPPQNQGKMASESQPPSQPLGPGYRDEAQRPTATVSKPIPQDNVFILEQTPQLIALLT